jgi:hypothetical protein
MTTIETLKEIGNAAMAAAKENIAPKGFLIPAVMTVVDGAVTAVIGVGNIPDRMNKQDAYRVISRKFSQIRPDAVITVNDSYMRSMDREEAKAYANGDLAGDHGAVECIVVAFKGPSIPAHMRCIPYERNGVGDIVFKEEEIGWREAELNLLPDWWRV